MVKSAPRSVLEGNVAGKLVFYMSIKGKDVLATVHAGAASIFRAFSLLPVTSLPHLQR